LAGFCATGWSLQAVFALYQPTRARSASLSPDQYALLVPARQAYSHSASDGSLPPSQWQNKLASYQEISFAAASRSMFAGDDEAPT
jgi:hypothetical protein